MPANSWLLIHWQHKHYKINVHITTQTLAGKKNTKRRNVSHTLLDTFQSIHHYPGTEKLSNIQTRICHNDPRLGFISIMQWFISKASPPSEVTGVEDQGTKFGSIRESARMFLPLSRAFLPNAAAQWTVYQQLLLRPESTHSGVKASRLTSSQVSILNVNPHR